MKIDEQIEAVTMKMNDPNLCKGTASTYTRISGYFRPVQTGWNQGKVQEYSERKEYSI